MGYTNVFVYNEGLPEWVKRGYPAELNNVYPKPDIATITAAELKGMIDRNEDVLVIDLRDEEDVKAGRIKGSKHIEMELLDDRVKELPKNKKIVLQCLYGKQGYMAARYLVSVGFDPQSLMKLDGGIIDGWMKAGYPLER